MLYGTKDIVSVRTIKTSGFARYCATKIQNSDFCDSEFFHGKDWGIKRAKLQKGNKPNF